MRGTSTQIAVDAVLTPGETYRDPKTGCGVQVEMESSPVDLFIVLHGNRKSDVDVNLFRPDAAQPLTVSGRYEETLSLDDGEYPILRHLDDKITGCSVQFYRLVVIRNEGLFRIEIELDDNSTLLTWRIGGWEH